MTNNKILSVESIKELLTEFDLDKITSQELLEDYEYTDVLQFYKDLVTEFNLSFYISELDSEETIVYRRDKDTIHILQECLPEWNTIEELYTWLATTEGKVNSLYIKQ